MDEYVKIRKQILTDVADAIRLQKETTRTYNPADFARIIKAMLVLPSGEANSTISGLSFDSTAVAVLPTVHKATATSTISGMAFTSSASAVLTE